MAFIDYLSFTYRTQEPVVDAFPLRNELINLFGIPQYDWKLSRHGWNGYTHRITLPDCGLVAFGGKSQRNTIHVQLSGQGCRHVPDWFAVHAWATANTCKIARIDLAHDDFEGAKVNIANALSWRSQGLFNSRGRPPSCHLIDDFDSGKGKTFYAGNRANGKMIRIYEKGKQLERVDSPWCRAEVEFRAKDRTIDWDIVVDPDPYFGGACDAFAQLTSQQSRITTHTREKHAALDRNIAWARIVVGPLVNLLYILLDGDAEAVVNILRRSGIPRKLEPHYRELVDAQGVGS
ncbi:MAG: replication initiation factor domain-containing protein [Pseudohongiellaceae bacterium]